jgi:hypothetical protein
MLQKSMCFSEKNDGDSVAPWARLIGPRALWHGRWHNQHRGFYGIETSAGDAPYARSLHHIFIPKNLPKATHLVPLLPPDTRAP